MMTLEDFLSARPAPLSVVSRDTSSPTVLPVVVIQPVRKLPIPSLTALSKLGSRHNHHPSFDRAIQDTASSQPHNKEGAGQALPMAGNQYAPAMESPAWQQNYTEEKHIKP